MVCWETLSPPPLSNFKTSAFSYPAQIILCANIGKGGREDKMSQHKGSPAFSRFLAFGQFIPDLDMEDKDLFVSLVYMLLLV